MTRKQAKETMIVESIESHLFTVQELFSISSDELLDCSQQNEYYPEDYFDCGYIPV
jgi:hypothetical protein